MKIEMPVTIDHVVTVDVSHKDIRDGLREHPGEIYPTLNAVGTVLRAVTREQIAQLNAVQKKLVREYLRKEASRYDEPGTEQG